MAIRNATEEQRLPGATTSTEESDGLEPIFVQILDGVAELEVAVAPAGDVLLVAMNRGDEPVGLQIRRRDAPASTIVDLAPIPPGDAEELVMRLGEGDYIVSTTDQRGALVSAAALTVQPRQRLATDH